MSILSSKDFQQLKNNKSQTDRQRNSVNEVLSALRNRLQSANTRSGMSVRDLFGDSIDRFSDNVRSNANATKQALARLGGISGDNVTGASNVAFNRVDQRANQNIGDAIRTYSDRTANLNERALSRGDNMLQLLLSGETGLYNTDISIEEAARDRKLARQQANRQMIGDILGTAGNVGAAFIQACWVAAELYGSVSNQTRSIRTLILANLTKPTPLGLFAKLYSRYGRQWASQIKPGRFLARGKRYVARKLYNHLYNQSVSEPVTR